MNSTNLPTIRRVEGIAMPVNSYLVDGPTGVVVVDGQLTVSDANAVRHAIDELGKPVAGLLITHPHPDHYAGAATLLDGLDAPIVTTPAVADIIARDDAEKHEIVGPMMGAEWPAHRRMPDQLVDAGSSIELGGLTFDVVEVGPAESHADVLYVIDERTIFSGDIAYNDAHAYLLDGHYREWLAALERLSTDLDADARLYVGHGEPADLGVLDRQAAYVRAFVDVVGRWQDAEQADRHAAVVAAMHELVGDDRLLFLMELSIEPMRDLLAASPT